MHGKIVKGIAGFYYVHVVGSGVYECKAKGIFRRENKKPLVGDDVEIEILDEKDKEGNITEVLPRRSELFRPAVANIDQALLVFAVARPDPHFNLLDRFLVTMESRNIPVVLCFNKADLVSPSELSKIERIYAGCGSPLLFLSVREKRGLTQVRELLKGKTTVIAGPSGVGKSSLINFLYPEAEMETGSISRKIGRGRHTTRHSELFFMDDMSYIMDTPGFSSLYVNEIEKEELRHFFPEFAPYSGQCRFSGCEHIHEPDCAVREAVEQGKIHTVRYENYREIYEEIKSRRKY